MGVAANSWLVFMDQLLILGDDCANEKDILKNKMLKLIDIYYDALDTPKRGKKVSCETDFFSGFINCHLTL
jgi:RNA-dependent RNA polymerase